MSVQEWIKHYQKQGKEFTHVIDYVYDSIDPETNFCYQLVRVSDLAIIATHRELKDCQIACWRAGIHFSNVIAL